MKKLLNNLLIVWRILYPAGYSFLLLALAGYALIYNDQGRDFFVGVAFNGISLLYIVKTSITIVIWCLLIWYTNRIVLQVKDIDVPDDKFTNRIIRWLPRLLALVPLVIVTIALFKGASIIHFYKWKTLIVYTLVTLAIGSFLILFFIKRPALARKLGIDFKDDKSRFTPHSTTIPELMKPRATKLAIRLIIIVNVLFFILFFLPIEFGFARLLQSATIVFCGFIFFTVVSAFIVLKFSTRRSPAFIILLMVVILFSTNNDNSSIRTLKSNHLPAERENIETSFTHWLSRRIPPGADSANPNSPPKIYPIIIVAAEGGGIRGNSWTAQVLKKLNDQNPAFMEHVFAISGVSGGGVGSVFFTSYYHDLVNQQIKDYNNTNIFFENAVSSDFLSDLTASFIFSDNLQRILPFPVDPFSRNRKLEDSWGIAYRQNLQSETMNNSFLDIWYGKKDDDHMVPNLFINGALAETGQKAITSNLALHSGAIKTFSDDVDVLEILGSDVPVKTAASLCARFPVITSGALLKENGKRPVGHVIDGGYKENSGIETAWQLILGLNRYIRQSELNLNNKWRFPVYLLFIQNSTDAKSISDSVAVADVIPDLSTILPGFINAWDRRTTLYKNITAGLFSDTLLNERYAYFEYKIKNNIGLLPLGWSLSDSARRNISEQVNAIKTNTSILTRLK